MAYQPKNRKFLAGTITAAVVASAVAPAASAAEVKFTDLAGLDAETNTAIESLVGLEVIKGYPDGTFKPNQTINRGQAAEMTVKALKLETPAPTGKVFEDLTDKSYYAKFAEALATAKLIPAGGKFGAGTDMTREAMAVALVSGLGLKATDKAVEVKDLETASPEARDAIKILAQHDVTKLLDGNFNPKDAVKRSQFALFFYRGVEAAGLNKSEVTAEVKVVDVNKIEVKFNKAVDTTKVTAALKIGAASLYTTSTFSEDKKSVVLTAPSAIATGSYNVVISGIAAADVVKPITVEAAAPKAISVSNTEAYLKDNALVTFSVLNQYGTDMGVKANNADLVVTAYNVTQSKAVDVVKTSSTKSELGLNLSTGVAAGAAKVGDEVRVILTYKGVTVTKVLKVVADAATADITLGTVAPLKDKTRITTGETGLELPYTLKDQYGNDLKITNLATSGVTFVSSDNTVVNPATFSADATTGKITFAAGAAGTATITAIINATGKVAQTTVTVSGTSALKTVVISSPTALISAGQTVNLDLAGADQFGGAVTDFSGVAVSDNNDNVTASIVNGKLRVVTSGTAAGTATITLKKASDATVTYGTITITFEKVAEPTVLVSVDTISTLEVGATTTVKLSDIKVKDQYGRDFALTDANQVTVKAVDDTFSGVVQDPANKLKFDAATAPGTEAVSFTLANGATKTVTFATVASSSVTSYSINTVGTLLAQGDSATLGAYNVTLGLAGKLADGTTVKLATSKVTHATSNNEAVATVSVDATTKAVTVKGLTKGSSLVTLYAGATKLAEVTVNVDNATPIASSVEFAEAGYTIDGTAPLDLKAALTVKDQYGVAYAKNGFFATSDSTIAAVSADGVVTKAGTKTGNVTITYVTTNGIVKTVTVTVN
jgi:trimeric autotransporter adhesin